MSGQPNQVDLSSDAIPSEQDAFDGFVPDDDQIHEEEHNLNHGSTGYLGEQDFFQAVEQSEQQHEENGVDEDVEGVDGTTEIALKRLLEDAADNGIEHSHNNDDLHDDRPFELDPTLASIQQGFGDEKTLQNEITAQNQSQHPVKRKATSRANMLTRGGACEFCKRRKLKCSAEEPSCATCVRAGRECIYSQKKQKSRVKVLEDKLAELERRLEQERSSGDSIQLPDNFIPMTITPVIDNSEDLNYGNAFHNVDTAATLGLTPSDLSTGSNLNSYTPQISSNFPLPSFDGTTTDSGNLSSRVEPDLMTLADAAAGSSNRNQNFDLHVDALEHWPWENLSPSNVAREIIQAIDGSKGIGEKIVSHLLGIYLSGRQAPYLNSMIPAETLLARLSGRISPKPHPSLLLSIVAHLLPYSPSATISSPLNVSSIFSILQVAARAHSATATANPDGRLLDCIIGDSLRAMDLYRQGRFLDGWGEAAKGSAHAWAAGLGKLGGVGQQFVMGNREEQVSGERTRKIERELKLRQVVHKGQVVEPPRTAKEYGQRVVTFWNIFVGDRCASLGWGWPSSFIDIEITTPLPREDYDNPEALLDTRTLSEFLNPLASPSENDSDFCAFIKGQCLCYHAFRLFDQPVSFATPQRTAELLVIAQRHLTSLRPVPRTGAGGQFAARHGQLHEAWMIAHTAMMFLHAKNEIDVDPGFQEAHQASAIRAAGEVAEHISMAYRSGDVELEGMTISAVTNWYLVGSFVYRLNRRLAASAAAERNPSREAETKRIGDEMTRASHVVGKRMQYAEASAQLLENVAMGHEVKTGEWLRPDNIQ